MKENNVPYVTINYHDHLIGDPQPPVAILQTYFPKSILLQSKMLQKVTISLTAWFELSKRHRYMECL